jgi:hypothetical protein
VQADQRGDDEERGDGNHLDGDRRGAEPLPEMAKTVLRRTSHTQEG